MFLSFLMMLFLFLIVMGFARVVRYFWGWLRGGEKVDEDLVRREDIAEERAEEVADRDLEGIDTEDGPEQVVTLVRARADEINAYLDAMSLGWYQIAIVFFIGCMAGLLLEEIWMLITAGLAQNRVGLVWGPFSPLYGFGAVFLTVVSFELRRHGARGWQVFLVAAVIGGLLVGVLENIMGTYVVGSELKLVVALIVIIAVLIVRPSGLFGRKLVTRV